MGLGTCFHVLTIKTKKVVKIETPEALQLKTLAVLCWTYNSFHLITVLSWTYHEIIQRKCRKAWTFLLLFKIWVCLVRIIVIAKMLVIFPNGSLWLKASLGLISYLYFISLNLGAHVWKTSIMNVKKITIN